MKAKTAVTVSVVSMILIALLSLGGMYFFSSAGNSNDGVIVDEDGNVEKTCDGVKEVKHTLKPVNEFKLGTDLSGISQYIKDNGNESVAPNDLTPAKSYTSMVAWEDDTYYAKIVDFATECVNTQEQVTLSEASAPTTVLINENGISENSDSNPQAISADDHIEMELKLTAGSNTRWGAEAGQSVVVFEYNSGNVSKVELDGAESTSVPLTDDISNNSLYDSRVAFLVDSIADREKATYTVILENPDYDTGDVDVNIRGYDAQGFVNENGDFEFGVEDEDDSQLSIATWSDAIHLS